MNYSLVTAPASEPVSTAEAKTHLRVDHSNDDTYIDTLITMSRELVEDLTGLSLINQTWTLFMDKWPYSSDDTWWDGIRVLPVNYYQQNDILVIDRYPLSSVTHIKTYDNADTATTFDSSNYQVMTYSGVNPKKGRISLRDGQSWPTFDRNSDGIEIEFVSGFGSSGSDVPALIRQAMLEEISYRYEHRGDKLDGILSSEVSRGLLSTFMPVCI